MNDNFSIFEVLMLLCFACSWPVSIIKSLRTKVVIGKSSIFMIIIILGYVFGIVHKLLNDPDPVTWLYLFNLLVVLFDLILYFIYIKKNRRELFAKKQQNHPNS
jgi:hypothetical protein